MVSPVLDSGFIHELCEASFFEDVFFESGELLV